MMSMDCTFKLYLIVGLVIMSTFTGHAQSKQQIDRCGTDDLLQEMKQEDPDLQNRIDQYWQKVRNWQGSTKRNSNQQVYTIPVVVHVMHNGQSIGNGTNISKAQVTSQIEVLNEDFRMNNSDTSDVPSHFEDDAADTKIEFCLASIDPEGNPTNGIDRVDMGPNGSWSDNLKSQTIWNSDKYLNIWVADISGGTLGYATMPGQSPNEDGVVIGYEYFGRSPANPFTNNFNLGRTTTHEVGHWLGLFHTFQEGCAGTSQATCDTDGDKICDTPPTQSSNSGCPSFSQNTCSETPVDKKDMWMNYMDYVNDDCMFMFTKGQKDVMRGVLNTTRQSILTSSKCQKQNYFSYSGQVVKSSNGKGVPNAKVLFQRASGGFIELTTSANGTFSTSSFRSGTYDVYAGKWGYQTVAHKNSLTIDSVTSSITIPIDSGVYYDDFLMDFGWSVTGDAQTGIWERGLPIETTYNGDVVNPGEDIQDDFGGKCMITGNAGGDAGDDDIDDGMTVITSRTFDLSSYGEPYLHYYRWFYNDGGRGDPVDDTLIIRLSNGTTTEVIDKAGPGTNGNNQWTKKVVRIEDYLQLTANMELSVQVSDMPNAGHLVEGAFDGFHIVDSSGANRPSGFENMDAEPDLRVYPNPTKDVFHLQGSIPEVRSNVRATLVNPQGKQLARYKIPVQADGNIERTVNLTNYEQGVYFLRVISESTTTVKKISLIR